MADHSKMQNRSWITLFDEAAPSNGLSVREVADRTSLDPFDDPHQWLIAAKVLLSDGDLPDACTAFEHAMDLATADGILDVQSAKSLAAEVTWTLQDRMEHMGVLLGNAYVRANASLCIAMIMRQSGDFDHAYEALRQSEHVVSDTVQALEWLSGHPKRLGFQLQFTLAETPALMGLIKDCQQQREALNSLRYITRRLDLN